jgi:solute:Na+ symporter, SSS family
MAACLAFSVLLGWGILPALLLFSAVSMAYLAWGGIRAVVWTNVLQALVFIVGGVATFLFLAHLTGGFGALFSTAAAAGKLKVLQWGPDGGSPGFWPSFFANPNILWLAVLNGLFGSMAAFGTDQDLMQRLLTLETRRESQRTMALTIPVSLGVLMLYLAIGAGLFAFYAQNPALPLPDKLDKIFPHFIGHVMPPLLKGLMLSAIVLASIDSPLVSLTTSFVTDVYRPLRPGRPDGHYLAVSRGGVLGFGLVLAGLAWGFSHFEKILWLAFKIGGVTFGSLLGVFLLGLLTRRRANRANAASMVFSAAAMLTLLILSEKKIIPLGWSWLVILGTVMTFSGGWMFGTKSADVQKCGGAEVQASKMPLRRDSEPC